MNSLYIFEYLTLFLILIYIFFKVYQKSGIFRVFKKNEEIINRLSSDKRFLFRLSILYSISISLFFLGAILIFSLDTVHVVENWELLKVSFKISSVFIFIYLLTILYLIGIFSSIIKVLFGLILFSYLGLIFIFSSIINHINYKYDISNPISFSVQILQKNKSSGGKGPTTYYLYVNNYKNYKVEELQVSSKIYNSFDDFSFVTIGIKNGFLGFEYINSIRNVTEDEEKELKTKLEKNKSLVDISEKTKERVILNSTYERAEMWLERKNCSNALAFLNHTIDYNFYKSLKKLSDMYAHGDCVEKNQKESEYWYKRYNESLSKSR